MAVTYEHFQTLTNATECVSE